MTVETADGQLRRRLPNCATRLTEGNDVQTSVETKRSVTSGQRQQVSTEQDRSSVSSAKWELGLRKAVERRRSETYPVGVMASSMRGNCSVYRSAAVLCWPDEKVGAGETDRQSEGGSESEAHRDGPRHSDLTMRYGEDLG